MTVQRVVFLCSGNTCRSPLAAAILRARRPEADVLSAGLAAHEGSPAAESARAIARERGLELESHRAQAARNELFAGGAIGLCMTRQLAEEARRRFPQAADRILSLGEYAGHPDQDVDDPIGQGNAAYRGMANQVAELLRAAEQRSGWLFLQATGLGSDHAGLILKREVLSALRQAGIPALDYGTDSAESCDYPDFAQTVGRAVASGEMGAGILICGTGIGMSIAANKIVGVRAALAGEGLAAELSRRHNDANVLCLGARLTGPELAREAALRFLRTEFEAGRHARRVAKITAMDLDNP